jgi:hypothetical protein
MGASDAVLEIAGAGDYRPNLEALARSLDLGDRVRFLGRISETEKLALLRRSWALVFASPKEGWGITNLEAAACATPVVASNSPGIRESVRDGETGFLVPHGDTNAMAEAMRRVDSSRELVTTLGRSARAFSETFTWGAPPIRPNNIWPGSSEQRHESAIDGRPSARAHAHAAQLDHIEERTGSIDPRESGRLEPGLAVAGYVERFPPGAPSAWRNRDHVSQIARSRRSPTPSHDVLSFPIPCVFITKGRRRRRISSSSRAKRASR